MRSIISNEPKCYLCGSVRWLEVHHIFNASYRNKSGKYGLVVYLCHHCHNEPPFGVHHNQERNTYLKQIGQQAFIKHYPNKDFIKEFGKNYL